MSSQNSKMLGKQLLAWVWETGVIFDFEEICTRVECIFFRSEETLKSYFNEGKKTTLLFAAREVQRILKDFEEDDLLDPIHDLLKLTISLLKNEKFYLDDQFMSDLIILHLSAVLFANVNLDFAHDDELLLKPPYDDNQWERAKAFLKFKDDHYKEKLVNTSETICYMKKKIIPRGEKPLSSHNSCENLKEKLQKHFKQWVRQLPRPALCILCRSNDEELKKLLHPQHKIIFKYIINGNITTSSLHHILNELEANPNPFTSSQSPPLLYIESDPIVTPEMSKARSKKAESVNKNMSIDKNTSYDCKCCNDDDHVQIKLKNKSLQNLSNRKSRRKSNFDIIMLKGTIWEINKEESSDEEFCNDDDIEIRNVVDIRKQTIEWDTCRGSERASGYDKVYEIRTVSEDCDLDESVSLCLLDQLNKDINNLDKLVKETKALVAELEQKSLLLKKKRMQIKKSNENDKGSDYKFGVHKRNCLKKISLPSTSVIKENKSIHTLVEDDPENFPIYSKASTATSTIAITTPTNNNENKRSSCESSSSYSIPNLTPYEDVEILKNVDVTKSSDKTSNQKTYLHASNSSEYNSDRSMPNLTPYKNSTCDLPGTEVEDVQELSSDLRGKGSPIVSLTPLRKSVIDKFCPLESSKASGKDALNKNEEVNSLTKIDLVVTNSHSSPESHLVILEPNDSTLSSSKKRRLENSNTEESPRTKKRSRIRIESTSSEEMLSKNIREDPIVCLNEHTSDNHDELFGGVVSESSSISVHSNNNNNTSTLRNSPKKTGVLKILSETSDFEDFSSTDKSKKKRYPKTKSSHLNNSRNESSKPPIELSSSSDEEEEKNNEKNLRSRLIVDSVSQRVSSPVARTTQEKDKLFSSDESSFTISDYSDSATSSEKIPIKKKLVRSLRVVSSSGSEKQKNGINSSHMSEKKNLSPYSSSNVRNILNKSSILNGESSKLKLKRFSSLVVSTSESSDGEEGKLNRTSQQGKRPSEADYPNKPLKTPPRPLSGLWKKCRVQLLYNESESSRMKDKIYK